MHYRSLWLCTLMLLLAFPLAAQDGPMTTIITTGSAQVEVAPDHVVFIIKKTFDTEGDAEQALLKAAAFESAVEEIMPQLPRQPLDYDVAPPASLHLLQGRSTVALTLHYSLAGITQPDGDGHPFGRLCNTLSALAATLEGEIQQPIFSHTQAEDYERQAIQMATENAYPPGEAIAESLGTSIYAVDTVDLVKVSWKVDVADVPTEPTLTKIVCSASVNVRYALSL